ncbi:MAG TPA: 2-succinyl-6-hydroxy-2,4-cyclohexadiene-1-carboxylate synthase [Kiritimatiellia bacterium]|nr:2-succinyl-6-hydroxy-2,4-cyclohexadiene-1-carboxylate synthase [Kiritimatiellia bacterium]HMP00227.1 2-succinyl-6-hydroxy-2,4-cyclohexadiene-1-carboxylate synthase [Kiritimatiellia bacterium]HMP97180.1 2-succinyl-6-hydroxy-2,4-cyclohexadiene-1-carboxylate synthase [Kiritimatiellia bacterium]
MYNALLLHGFLGCGEDWGPVVDRLAIRVPDLHCLTPDLPGHGKNREIPAISPVKEVLAWLEQKREMSGCPRWHLAGYSLGGRIALHYALAYPERVASLTLISSSPGIDDEAERERRRVRDAIWAEMLRNSSRNDFLDAWYKQPVFGSLREKPGLLASIKARRSVGNAERLAQVLTAWGQGRIPSLWSRLSSLAVPGQWIVGAEDEAYVEMTYHLKNLLPEACIVRIPGAGHTVHVEQPDAVADAMAGLIKQGS